MTATGAFVLHVLESDHAEVAERFSRAELGASVFDGVRVQDSEFGPELTGIGTRACCRVSEVWTVGHQYLVQGAIERLSLHDMHRPLIHFRGAYRTLAVEETAISGV